MKKILEDSVFRITLCVAAISIAVMLIIHWFHPEFGFSEFNKSLYGLLLDILFFGLFIRIIEIIQRDRDQITRWKEELEDYLGWNESEASHRIVGLIKRIKKNNPMEILNLKDAYFYKVTLSGTDQNQIILNDSKLTGCEITESRLINLIFKNSPMVDLKPLSNTEFNNVHFVGEKNKISSFTMTNCNFLNCKLNDCVLDKMKFEEINFSNTNFKDNSWEIQSERNLRFSYCTLVNCHIIFEDLESISIENCNFENTSIKPSNPSNYLNIFHFLQLKGLNYNDLENLLRWHTVTENFTLNLRPEKLDDVSLDSQLAFFKVKTS